MKPLRKDQSQAIHFKRELADRYSIYKVNRVEYRALCYRASLSGVLIQQSDRVSVRAVSIRGQSILCVFDSVRGTLVTALPPDVGPDQVHEYIARRRRE